MNIAELQPGAAVVQAKEPQHSSHLQPTAMADAVHCSQSSLHSEVSVDRKSLCDLTSRKTLLVRLAALRHQMTNAGLGGWSFACMQVTRIMHSVQCQDGEALHMFSWSQPMVPSGPVSGPGLDWPCIEALGF